MSYDPIPEPPTTITSLLSRATTEAEIRDLLNNGNNQNPDGHTRRNWLRIARQRRSDQRIDAMNTELALRTAEFLLTTPRSAKD